MEQLACVHQRHCHYGALCSSIFEHFRYESGMDICCETRIVPFPLYPSTWIAVLTQNTRWQTAFTVRSSLSIVSDARIAAGYNSVGGTNRGAEKVYLRCSPSNGGC